MRLENLQGPAAANAKTKRVGRGIGSGMGKTSCRGQKGQKARSGGGIRLGFEGGQMPLQRRIPKRGFNNIFRKEYAIVNVGDLDIFEENTVITPEVLKEAGLVKKLCDGVKLLGDGDLEKAFTIKLHKVSKTAEEKVLAKGGKIEVI